MQWNVWCEEDIKNTARFLENHKADIICLQELSLNYSKQAIKNTPDYIAKQLAYNYYYKETAINSSDGEKIWLANGIFSKYPITGKKYFWTKDLVIKGSNINDKCVYIQARINLGKTSIMIGTTHMTYTDRFELTPEKRLETNNLCGIISNNQKNYILMGDLNAAPDSYTINTIGAFLNNIGPSFSEKTWTTKPFSLNGFIENNLNWRLDHIFATTDVRPVTAQVLKTDYSDHLPVWAEVEIE